MITKRSLSLLILLCLIIAATAYFQSQTAPDFEADFGVFTEEELAWLEENPVILYAPDHEFYPFEYYEDGTYLGFSIDYIDWIKKHYGLGIETVDYDNWDEILIALNNKEIDLITSTARSLQRDSYILFTIPYTSMDYIAFIHQDTKETFYDYDLPNFKTAVIRNYITQDVLEERYPDMSLVLVENSNEGFQLLTSKEVDVFISSAGQAIKSIEDLNLMNVRANENVRVLSSAPLHMGTHSSNPELATILTKILKNMPQSEKDEIFNKWMNIEFSSTFTPTQYKRTLIIGVVITLFIVIVFIWNQLLQHRVQMRSDDIRNELKQRYKLEHQLKNIINSIPSPIYVRDEEGVFVHVNQAFCDIVGVSTPSVVESNPDAIPNVLTEQSATYFTEMNDFVLRKDEAYHDRKNTVLFKNGTSYTFDSLKLPFRLLESSKKGILSIDVDISERESLYKQLETANKNLEKRVLERTEAIQKLNEELTHALQKISENELTLQETNDELSALLITLKATQQELIEKETMGAQGLRLSQISKQISKPIQHIQETIQELSQSLTELIDTFGQDEIQRDRLYETFNQIEKSLETIRHDLQDSSSIVETFKLISIVDHGLQPTRINLRLMLETCYSQVLYEKPYDQLHCPPELMLHASPNAFHQIIIHIMKFMANTDTTDSTPVIQIEVLRSSDQVKIKFKRENSKQLTTSERNMTDLGVEIIESILIHYFRGTLKRSISPASIEVTMSIPSIFVVKTEEAPIPDEGGNDYA